MHEPPRPCKNLSRRQRAGTPLPFARRLLSGVQSLTGCTTVAALWVQPWTVYHQLWPEVELWGVRRDAWNYPGPYPIIAHPPCGPWGKYRRNCKQPWVDGVLAMALVHRWGGVIEQPLGSQLFRLYGAGGRIERVNQADYGHVALKPTLLYWCERPA